MVLPNVRSKALAFALSLGSLATLLASLVAPAASANGIIFGTGVEITPGGNSTVISGNGSGVWILPSQGNYPNLGGYPNNGSNNGIDTWEDWSDYRDRPPFLGDDDKVPLIINEDDHYGYHQKFTLESEAGTVNYYLQPMYSNSYYQGSIEPNVIQWWQFSTGGAVIWFDGNPDRYGVQWKSYQLDAGEQYFFRKTKDGRRLELFRRA
jgi:hypothetical protein